MDPEMESLKNQLDQMKSVLPLVEGVEKVEIQNVITQLEQLISTKPSPATNSQNNGISIPVNVDDSDDEYARFSAEIASISAQESNDPTTNNSGEMIIPEESDKSTPADIQEELTALEGMKCMAPHEEGWGQIGYYPAMVSEVVNNDENDSDESNTGGDFNCVSEIKVRVVFLHPVVRSQLLCPFYKENNCDRSEFKCGYSHGEVVYLSNLRDYNEPDYSLIIPSARVLAKYHDELWYKATVVKLTSGGNCKVEFDKHDNWLEVGIHETVPLHHHHNGSDDSQSDEAESGDDSRTTNDDDARQIECNLLSITSSDVLGDWEKHTTGFGSKLMMKMGYIMGKGLGKQSEGRIIPVPAIMVPPGMSLDQFMLMKEKRTIGSVEKMLKRAQKRHGQKEKQLLQKTETKSVFDFMNSRLSLGKNRVGNNKPSSSTAAENNVAKKACNLLKKDMLSVGEQVKKVCKDISRIKDSLKRIQGKDAATEKMMKTKLDELESKKNELVRIENNIIKEQKNRSDKKKLTEF